jgi:hypothetical protein
LAVVDVRAIAMGARHRLDLAILVGGVSAVNREY